MRKLVIAVVAAFVLGAVAPLSGAAAIAGGTIQFVPISGSDSPPVDANGNGILDHGDYLIVDDTLQVTGSSVAPVSVGTIATLRGTLLLRSPEVVRADLDLSLPTGSFHLFGFFSASVFSGSGQTINLFAAGRAGVFRSAQGRLQAVTGENTTFTLTLAPFSYLPWFATSGR